MKSEKNLKILALLGIVGFCIVYRFLSQEPNFSPLAAAALFSGFLFPSIGFLIPLSILLISDFIFGFYSSLPFVYLGFFVVFLLGRKIARLEFLRVFCATLGGSFSFFLISNFGHWLMTSMYSKTLSGLFECYIAAIPFFRASLVGNLFFVGVFFGVYVLAQKSILASSPNQKA